MCAAGTMPADSSATRMGYPERLWRDFPVIYSDTAYASPEYSIVVRAVWMKHKRSKCKVTSPDLLPLESDSDMVTFGRVTGQDTMMFHTETMVMHRK